MMSVRRPLYLACFFVAGCFLLSGCSQNANQDLVAYMDGVKQKPSGEVPPLPTFRSYKTFHYGAVSMRSPFDPPVVLVSDAFVSNQKTVDAPDDRRQKEYLEGFNFAQLSMVGVMSRNGKVWSLINDGAGGIHRVTVGNYIGKNHGQIKAVEGDKIDVVETVPNGRGGWVERPRSLVVQEQ